MRRAMAYGLALSGVCAVAILAGGWPMLWLALPGAYWTVAVLLNPLFGLLLTLASIPVADILPKGPVSSSATSVLAAFTFFSFLLHGRQRWVSVNIRTNWWAAGFLFALALSSVFAPVFVPRALSTYFQLFVFLLLLQQMVRTREEVDLVMMTWIGAMAVVQISGLLGYDFAAVGRHYRFESMTKNANLMAFFSLLSACFALHFTLSARTRALRALAAALLAFDVVAVLLSVSRTGLVVLVLLAAVSAWMLRHRLPRRGLASGFVLLCVLAYFARSVNLAPVVVELERVPTMVQQHVSEPGSFGDRVRRWRRCLERLPSSPFFGVGLSATDPLVDPTIGVPHNAFVTILTENGFFGLAMFLGLLVTAARSLLTAGRREAMAGVGGQAQAWLLALYTWGLMSLTNDFQYSKTLWLILAVAVVLRRVAPSRPEPSYRLGPARCAG